MTSPTIVQVTDVSKKFILHKDKSLKERLLYFGRGGSRQEEFWALRDIDLEISSGSTLGLVGHNGSGKSTLLKTIGGIIEPTTGSIKRRGRLAALLELGAGFHPDLSGRENVYLNAAILGLTRRETDKYFDAIVDFAAIEEFVDTQVKFYSSGMYVRLAFAVAVHVDPDLLLVDEVLAVGDEPFQRKCMDKIAEFQAEGRTIVLVSHSADQVGRLCDRVAVLDGGRMVHDGDPSDGLRVLREHYEQARQRRVTGDDREASGPYTIRSVDAHVIEGSGMSPGLEVVCSVDIRKPAASWGIGLSIDSNLGMRLFEMGTFGQKLPNTVGVHDVVLRFDDVGLGAGTYLINIGVGTAAGTTFDRIPGAAAFEMPKAPTGQGLLRLHGTVSVRDSSA
ncbi:MAG TPA: polysaccharide ABC transporter ATP-binding protein [Pseudolysinimonas sp.]|nr:polysaccharide ABC transporter ATP-binding protein [Pseudolysinimonas sp.]